MALALSRKIGEALEIGRDITVSIRSVTGGRVVLAIDAPASVKILRSELSRESDGNEAPDQGG
jgi:carbon storage regulator